MSHSISPHSNLIQPYKVLLSYLLISLPLRLSTTCMPSVLLCKIVCDRISYSIISCPTYTVMPNFLPPFNSKTLSQPSLLRTLLNVYYNNGQYRPESSCTNSMNQ